MEFGPCLLKQLNPDLSITTVSESRTLAWVTGQIIVDNDWGFNSIDIEYDKVASSLIQLLRVKQVCYLVWEFCHTAKNCEEVAVAQSSLLDVVGFNVIFEYCGVFVNLADSPPFKSLVLSWLHLINIRVVQRAQFRRKLSVSPSLARRNDRVHFGFQISCASLVPFHGCNGSLAVPSFDHVAIFSRCKARTVSHCSLHKISNLFD